MKKFRKFAFGVAMVCIFALAVPVQLFAQTEGSSRSTGAGAVVPESGAAGAGATAGAATSAGVSAGTIAVGAAVAAAAIAAAAAASDSTSTTQHH